MLWKALHACSSSNCWGILGDFNEIKCLLETFGGDDSWDYGMQDFKDCLESLGVDEIRGMGPHHTWWNCQESTPIHKKLVRALGNAAWFSFMPNVLALFAPRGLSDHSPIILSTGLSINRVKKPFQFFSFMLDLNGFLSCVQNSWNTQLSGNPLFVLSEKLKLTKKALIALNKSVGNLTSSVQAAKQVLHIIQSNLHSSPTDSSLLEQERVASLSLWKALALEENLMQQKSRATWLATGDKNTKFFSNVTKSRWNSNKILSINDSAGMFVEGQ